MRFNFRAWHHDAQEMIPNCDQGFEGDVFNWAKEGQAIDILQNTGAHDHNGVEIYEHDIVSDHIGVGVVEYCDKHAGFRVNYKNGRCKWFYDYILEGERESIKVIGNVYENTEILKRVGEFE